MVWYYDLSNMYCLVFFVSKSVWFVQVSEEFTVKPRNIVELIAEIDLLS